MCIHLDDVYTDAHRADFGMFYLEGRAWLEGEPAYQNANLNTPFLTLVAFAPLALLPLKGAQIAWRTFGVVPC